MRKTKILLSVMLPLLFVFMVCAVGPFALAAESYTLSVNSDKETANIGDIVNISMVLEPEAHIGTMTVGLIYDAAYFEYQNDAAAGAALSNGMADINSKEPGKIVFTYITEKSLYDAAKPTVVMTASFKVLKTDGTFSISPETIGADDFDSTDITGNCIVKGKTIGGPSSPSPSGKVTVSFDANGGSGTMAAVHIDKGSSFTLPDCAFTLPADMEFNGWDQGKVGTTIVVNDDLTLKAQWTDKPAGNGESSGDVALTASVTSAKDSDAGLPSGQDKDTQADKESPVLLWGLLGVLVVCGIIALLIYLKKKQRGKHNLRNFR